MRAEGYDLGTPFARGGALSGSTRNPLAVTGGPLKPQKDVRATAESTRELAKVCPAMLSAAAGLIHLAAAYSHFGESALHGAFFIGTGLAQLAAAALLAYRSSTWILAATASGNALILAIWVMSRTTGIPLGPEAWIAEPVGIADAVASALELVLVIGSVLLLAPSTRGSLPPSSPELRRRWLVPVASVVVVLTGPAVFSARAEGHSHPRGGREVADVHSHVEVQLVGGEAMAGAAQLAGSFALPAGPTTSPPVPPPPAEPALVEHNTPPVPTQPEPPHPDEHQSGISPNVEPPHPHQGEEHQGHE